MLKKDKLHLILRAKHGSQIPKYNEGSSLGLIGNPFMHFNGVPTPMPTASLA